MSDNIQGRFSILKGAWPLLVAVMLAGCVTLGRAKATKPEMPVIGLVQNQQAKAYPLEAIESMGVIRDHVGGRGVTLLYDYGVSSVRVFNELGQAMPFEETTWGDWKARQPASRLHGEPAKTSSK